MKPNRSTILESCKLLCSDRSIEIAGRTFRPTASTAYVEFVVAHAFPVTTIDKTALHPQVVANSYRTMFNTVFDLAHLMKKYNPRNPHDRILGTIVEVEFPPTPAGGWKVQAERGNAPGIRAVACMHRNAEMVDGVLRTHFTGETDWTVSMENNFCLENSGFLIKAQRSSGLKDWAEGTPEDLAALGWTYIPADKAPDDLLDCFSTGGGNVKVKDYKGLETVALLGGLDGNVEFFGVGLTPGGKEAEAEVLQMLAGKQLIEVGGTLLPDVAGILKETAEGIAKMLKSEG